MLREYLAERDAPCPNCGYNLRGLTTRSCPECNQDLMLRVGLVEPRMGALLGALSGLLAGAGAAALFLVLVFIITVVKNDPPPRNMWFEFIGIPLIGIAVEGSLALLLARPAGRTWFRRLGPRARSGTILGCFLLTGCVAAWFMIAIWP